MKSRNLILSGIFIFVSIIFLQSCSDDNIPANSTVINVAGKVARVRNQGVPGIQVKIGEQTTTTSTDGNFTINNVTSPYSLILIDSNLSYLYKNLTSANIRIPDFSYQADNLTGRVSVTCPAEIFTPGVTGKVIFTDGNYVNAYTHLGQSSSFDVYLPDNSTVTGKVIVITYKKDPSENIISYENFGESPSLQLTAGGNITYDFTQAELSLNPGEANISGRFTIPSDFRSNPQYFLLTFASKLTRNYLDQVEFSTFSGKDFNIVIPTNLPRQYSIIVGNYIFNNSNAAIYTSESFNVPANSSGINLESKIPPSLTNPPDNATGVDMNTQFTFTPENGNGIYQIYFNDVTTGKIYFFVTDATAFTLASLSELGIGNISGSHFGWGLEKYGNAASVNDYLTSFSEHPGSFRTSSLSRSFDTAPN